MFIQLSKNLAIKSDQYQYKLCSMQYVKEKENDSGTIIPAHNTWVAYRYYVSLQRALESVPEQLLKESNVIGWQACKECLQDTYRLIADEMQGAERDGS